MSGGNWIDWASSSRRRQYNLGDCFVAEVLRPDRFKDGLLTKIVPPAKKT
jgi:hypothetical protein